MLDKRSEKMEKNERKNRRGSYFQIMISLGFLAGFAALTIFGAINLDNSFLIGFCIGVVIIVLIFSTWKLYRELIP